MLSRLVFSVCRLVSSAGPFLLAMIFDNSGRTVHLMPLFLRGE